MCAVVHVRWTPVFLGACGCTYVLALGRGPLWSAHGRMCLLCVHVRVVLCGYLCVHLFRHASLTQCTLLKPHHAPTGTVASLRGRRPVIQALELAGGGTSSKHLALDVGGGGGGGGVDGTAAAVGGDREDEPLLATGRKR